MDQKYSDINLKEKDYNNEQNLFFFIEQEKKAQKMLEEVKNFHKSFVSSKMVDFKHILSILQYVNWIDYTKVGTSRHDFSVISTQRDGDGFRGHSEKLFTVNVLKHIEFEHNRWGGSTTHLKYFTKLSEEQEEIFKTKHKRDFNKFKDFDKIRDLFGYDIYSDIEHDAEKGMWAFWDDERKILEAITKFCETKQNKGFIESEIDSFGEVLNKKFKKVIDKFILKHKDILLDYFDDKKFVLVGNNIPYFVTKARVNIDTKNKDKLKCNLIVSKSEDYEKYKKAPSWSGTRYMIDEHLEIVYDVKTNDYLKHTYRYSYETKSVTR